MTRSSYVVGLDVGSGSAKASIFTLDGTCAAEARRTYEPTTPSPGVAEYDAIRIQDAAVDALVEAAAGVEASAIAAIGIDAMMSGMVAINAEGVPVAPYTTTLDTRFSSDVERILHRTGPRIRALTGSGQPTLGPKIAWQQRTAPDIAARTAKYVLAGNLVAARLCDLDAAAAFVDPSYLWSTGLADVAARRWSDELCAASGIDPAVLPRIVESTDIVGTISAELAARTGIRPGTPIVAGCGDQPAGYLGSGAARPGIGADSAGTYAVVAAVTASFDVDPAEDGPDVIPVASGRRYNLQSMVVGGGLTRQWASRLWSSGREVDEFALDRRVAAAAPGARGVTFVPHLGGQAYPSRPDSRGAWLGLSWAHGPEDLYQAVLEGVAISNAIAFSRMQDLHSDVRLDRVSVYGGGARSGAWNQIKADALGVRYESLGDTPVAGLGAAMIAAQGVGLVLDAAERCAEIRRVEATYEPDSARHAVYRLLATEHSEVVSGVAAIDVGRKHADCGFSI